MAGTAHALSTEDFNVTMEGHVAVCEIRRPPHNFFDYQLINTIADTFEALDKDNDCRAIVLCAAGKSFCAGANFGSAEKLDADGNAPGTPNRGELGHLYVHAARLFATAKPIIGAIHGAAVGGGLGLAMVPDFRVTCPEARFSANFTRLGIHPGFGLTVTLPRLIGHQKAAFVFATARRFKGDEAVEMGLADILVAQDAVRAKAIELAAEIAVNSPHAVQSTRKTLRAGLVEAVRAQTDIELHEQTWLRKTNDFKEGVAAVSERRLPNFTGT
jgi:enoyl-CoA hydratase/carnithine racemase